MSLENTHCSELVKHEVDPKLAAMMNKPFTLASLLDELETGNLASRLEVFSDSNIYQNMESGNLKKGQQIWIFHNGETDMFNCVARINPYAHCVVYVGPRIVTGKHKEIKKIHEVVHVTKSWKCCTLMKAEIRKEDVLDVIKPDNKVFLGHPLKNRQMSANAEEAIAARANKCADPRKPPIRFDYDHK